MVQKVEGSNRIWSTDDGKTPSGNPAVYEFLFQLMKEERDECRLSYVVLKIQWVLNPHSTYDHKAIRT